MKNIFITFLLLTVITSIKAQTIRASLGPGTTANSVKLYIRPDIALPSVSIGSLQFNLGVSSTVAPIATATIRSTTSSFPTSNNWTVMRGSAPEGGFYNYSIYTTISPITITSILANTEIEVMEVAFTNGPITPQNVALVCLPDGGTSTNGAALFYFTSTTLNSNGNSLFYARSSAITVNNQPSYSADGTPGTGTSTATIAGVPLPTKFLSFYANKSDDNAKLTWTVDNEEDNVYFEVEASTDARTFKTIQKVDALRNGRSSNTYTLTDSRISRYNTGIIYYRIKQVEASGKITYSDVRQVNLEGKNFIAALYPNPVKTVTKLVIEAPEAGKATVIIRDATGKSVKQMNLQLQRGTNQQELDVSAFAAGDYNVTIVSDKLNQTIKMTKSN